MNNTIPEFICVCETSNIITIFSVLGVIIPLIISEILPLSNCESNGIIHSLIKLCEKRRLIAPRRGG